MDILLVMSDFERLSGASRACVNFREPGDFSRFKPERQSIVHMIADYFVGQLLLKVAP